MLQECTVNKQEAETAGDSCRTILAFLVMFPISLFIRFVRQLLRMLVSCG